MRLSGRKKGVFKQGLVPYLAAYAMVKRVYPEFVPKNTEQVFAVYWSIVKKEVKNGV